MVGVRERGELSERPKDAVGHWAGRCTVAIDDLDDPPLAEPGAHQCPAFQQHGGFLRAQTLAPKIDSGGLPLGVPAGRAAADREFWDASLIAPMTQEAEGRDGLFQNGGINGSPRRQARRVEDPRLTRVPPP
jgi:hypothetical protein